MIVRLTGTLTDLAEDSVVIEREGLAREVLVPAFAIVELASRRGQEVTLFTAEFLEGNHASGQMVPRILGFSRAEDRSFYMRFISVKGIGPRKALKALSQPVRRIASWIEASDAKSLSQLSGIGRRGAELIIASLKGKMEDWALPSGEQASGRLVQWSQSQRDALEVLVAWGDSRFEAERLLSRVAESRSDLQAPDDWVRAAYRVKSGAAG